MNSAHEREHEQHEKDPERPVAAPVGLEVSPAPQVDRRQVHHVAPGRHDDAHGRDGDWSRSAAESVASTSDLARLEIDARIDPGIGEVGDQVHRRARSARRCRAWRTPPDSRGSRSLSKPSSPSPSSEKMVSISSEPAKKARDEGAGEAGDDDQHGVAEDVAVEHAALRQALRARGRAHIACGSRRGTSSW